MASRQQTAQVASLPAPIGGLNARDAIANMDPNDAVVIDNFFVQPSWVETRNGYSVLGTFTGLCQTLMAYGSIAGTNQLYAAVNNAGARSIFRTDNASGGSVGAAIIGGATFALAGVAITGTAGQFSCTASSALLFVNQTVTISGTFGGTGSITGYANPTTYLISATNGSTTFTLKTQAGVAIVTTAGTPTGLTYTVTNVQAITNTRYDWVQFGTGSAEVLYALNGADNPLLYDGTNWYSVSGTSATYALTGVTPSTLISAATYKQRLWFIAKNSMDVWYLAQNTIAGALTQLNLAANFTLGGQLVMIITVSIDNAGGTNDYIAFVTNQGEVAVFSGYDPSSVNTWSLSAKFRIGRPITNGRRGWQKMGSDALMIGADGFILMSEALLTDRSQTKNAVSDKIRSAVSSDILNYAANLGWQVILFPMGGKVIVNVPTTTDNSSYQYVMNTLNQAWSTWNKVNNGYNAFCWENMGDGLYFGSNGFVAQADHTESDGTQAITCTCQQAFNYFGDPGKLKRFTQARCIFLADGNMQAAISMGIDFGPPPAYRSIPLHTGSNTLWGSLWGSNWGGSLKLSKRWAGVAGIGYSGSIAMATSVKNTQGQWQGSNIMYEPGGPFG